VCRAKGAKPDERKDKILFINADAEFHAGRAQNYLRPEHIEKITSAFDAFEDIPGYAAVISRDEIKSNDWNLNIRRYADNTPPPEPPMSFGVIGNLLLQNKLKNSTLRLVVCKKYAKSIPHLEKK
jgi:type I restriction-modification system DNA methylase subunit